MKLTGTYFSPFARRVGAALVVLDIPFEHEPLNVYVDTARADALNRVGKVPMLELDDGERLLDSGAILDYLDERVGPARALAPRAGAARRAALQLAAIATTLYEKTTARHAEEQRPNGGGQQALIERYRTQTLGGFAALDQAARAGCSLGAASLGLATLSAVIAYEYAHATHPDLALPTRAPALAAVAGALARHPAFAGTRP
ncbi:glutathione S-transferase [Burkholderia pyrrocinia]|nr:glutathione S-transferase [Burkholderia pyrrocinia]